MQFSEFGRGKVLNLSTKYHSVDWLFQKSSLVESCQLHMTGLHFTSPFTSIKLSYLMLSYHCLQGTFLLYHFVNSITPPPPPLAPFALPSKHFYTVSLYQINQSRSQIVSTRNMAPVSTHVNLTQLDDILLPFSHRL